MILSGLAKPLQSFWVLLTGRAISGMGEVRVILFEKKRSLSLFIFHCCRSVSPSRSLFLWCFLFLPFSHVFFAHCMELMQAAFANIIPAFLDDIAPSGSKTLVRASLLSLRAPDAGHRVKPDMGYSST